VEELNVLNHGSRSEQARMVSVAVSKRLKARDLDEYAVPERDVVSMDLLVAARKAAWALGARSDTYEAITRERAIPVGVSRMILNPGSRTAEQKDTGLRRIAQMRAERQQSERPRIITAAQIGLKFQYIWGAKGTIYRGAGHYTAGHRADGAQELVALVRQYHSQHINQGWGGLSYEALVADDGTIVLANPPGRKSAAVAMNNTGMVNVCCPGTTGHRMTAEQRESVEWLLANWHTDAVPRAHRMPRRVRAADIDWRGHRQHPGQSTACPGDMQIDYTRIFS
jgi:N-acetylmuramoyl-L-alanine amidase